MTRQHRQEALSLAYIQAVAAMCGLTHSFPSKDYGIDIRLHDVERRGNRFLESGVRLDIQAKSTTTSGFKDTDLIYDLDLRAYDDLRILTEEARLLVVLVLPKDEARWIRQSETKLELRKCVYWASLRGLPEVSNQSSIRVKIPRIQIFTPNGLQRIIETIKMNRSSK